MKTLLLLGALALSLNSFAQETYVPDDNFEAYLEANAMGNGIPNDDYVTTANISGVTSLLLINIGLNDVTGLEDFNSLTNLNIQLNPITTLTITNTNLTDLYCLNNSLSTLDVTSATAIEFIDCSQNQLTNLDFISNINLDWLRCDDNNLTSLDVSQNTALTNLYCFGNQLTSLDVSQNTALTNLVCSNNQLTSLDVIQNTALTNLQCAQNQLTSLDVSLNTALTNLDCEDNLLQCLNANNGQNFNSLMCANNPLSCVSVSDAVFAYNNYINEPWVTFQFQCVQNLIDNDVNQIGTLLTAVQQFGATYQWLDCNNNYAYISGETNQTYTPTTTGYFAVELTISDACRGNQVDTSSCHLVDYSGIDELNNTPKQLLKIVDLMGRETPYKPNTVLIFVFDDGSTEKVFKMD